MSRAKKQDIFSVSNKANVKSKLTEIAKEIKSDQAAEKLEEQATEVLRRKSIDDSIESLQRRIDKDSAGLEKTLEEVSICLD